MASEVIPSKVPRLALPLRMEGSSLATVAQDSTEDVAQCVFAVLSYEIGSRLEDPEFGIDDPSFGIEPIDTSSWIPQIARYEPRAKVTTSEDLGALLSTITVYVEGGARA